MSAPLAIDLYCGLGGWTEGLLAEGYDVIGFDIERHCYGAHRYPAQLVLQDVLTLHGSQFREAALIVASPPCQFFSYTSMPWSRAKRLAEEVRADPATLNAELALFRACFRLQAQASAAAGRHVPLVVENVRGAIPWVGRSRWNFGSYHLWGDVPALMPSIRKFKSHGMNWSDRNKRGQDFTRIAGNQSGIKNGGDWFGPGADCSLQRHFSGHRQNPDGRNRHRDPMASSSGRKRAEASTLIAKIPLPLARYIGAVFRGTVQGEAA